MANSDIGPLLARSAQARDSSDSSRKNSRDESYRSRVKSGQQGPKDEKVRSAGERYVSKAPKGSLEGDTKSTSKASEDTSESSKYPNHNRYVPLKDRRLQLSRSKSSHVFGDDDDDTDSFESSLSPTSASPNAYLASKGYASTPTATTGTSGSAANDLSRSRSTHVLKSREGSPDRSNDKDTSTLSSWARYLKNKYGTRNSSQVKDKEPASSAPSSSTSTSGSSNTARRLSLGLSHGDDDQKNQSGSLTSPTAPTTAAMGGATDSAAFNSARSRYASKCEPQFKIGSRGSESGCFTWPRGVAVGPDNTIVIADSSNHRVQVFDAQGRFLKQFGQYGSYEAEFDCLADVAVNRIGQFIVSDRYNHRIQVFDPSGRFLRAFGSQGSSDGRFNYPWGIATDSLGFIYVCDKENHRIQVFQSDGTFVGKFGSCGHKLGQLDHPHYIAVSSMNRVIISDTNNHRIQVFDVNGRALKTFGAEGSENGQFKFPRGVAVDDQGFICVADSGNNRIQIFSPDYQYIHSFGSWGSADGEFKGLEGIAVTSNYKILVCDRENHRIQAF